MKIGNKAVVATGLFAFGLALFWIAAAAEVSTNYLVLAATMILGGGGLGLITAPATEAILRVVPKEKAGVGSAVNDATRLFGATLGVAVIGSIAASLYANKLGSTIPANLPAQAAAAAKGSVGGALVAAHGLQQAGLPIPALALATSATDAFLHSFSWSLRVAGLVAFGGALLAAALLPSRPGREASADATEVVALEPADGERGADEPVVVMDVSMIDDEPA